MSERLWTATLTASELEARLTSPRDTAPFAILERLTAIHFPAKDEPIALGEWSQGRVFGPTYELCWERQNDGYRVWLAGEQATPGFTTELSHLADTEMTRVCCYMWGRDEMRIARAMDYRALSEGAGRVQLVRHEFRRRDGTLVYYRLAEMNWEAAS